MFFGKVHQITTSLLVENSKKHPNGKNEEILPPKTSKTDSPNSDNITVVNWHFLAIIHI